LILNITTNGPTAKRERGQNGAGQRRGAAAAKRKEKKNFAFWPHLKVMQARHIHYV